MNINKILNPKKPSEVIQQARDQADQISKLAMSIFIQRDTPAEVAFDEARRFLDGLAASSIEYVHKIYESNVSE